MIFFVPNKHIDVCPRSLADLVKKQLKISREIVTDLFHHHTAPSPKSLPEIDYQITKRGAHKGVEMLC